MGVRGQWRPTALAGTVVASLLLAACSSTGSDDSTGDNAAISTSSTAPSDSLPPMTDPTGTDGTSSTLSPEPTGVPGVDDEDEFCAAWARYSGTLQALGVASAFGEATSLELARLEVVAASALVDAATAIDAAWPAELEAEHAAVADDIIGPFERRAAKAIEALVAAGASPDDLTALETAWLDALRRRSGDQPVIAVAELPDDLAAIVDRAADAFDAAMTPFAADPSLVTENVHAPLTDVYLSEHCPDLASSGVGDAL